MNSIVNFTIAIYSLVFFSSAYGQNKSYAPEPYGAIPTERQLKWHEMEMYCLVHFTPTTFQNKEWGYGDADPSIFNPKKFDARQIVNAAKSGGFNGIIIVAKHHDGFALWPTKTATYNISESPWKNGKGDMVKEFMLAAKQQNMKFGIYCSPWDRNNLSYGTPAYVDLYRNQLKELYSNYGPLFMSWHDGANGGDGFYGGKKETRKVDQSSYYDWLTTWKMTRKLQPDASIFSDIGLDVRWIGNEKGIANETSWSTITLQGIASKPAMPGFLDDSNLGSGTRHGKQWIPFEADVALRPGWFYHPEQDNQLKTVSQLFHIYCNSVGRGGGFDLGLSPTTEGILHPYDVKTLAAFGRFLKSVFKLNLATNAKITLSNVRNGKTTDFGASNLIDNNRYSYWGTDDKIHNATITLQFQKPVKFSIIQFRENIKLGQRIDSLQVEMLKNNQWVPLAKAISIGANRLIRLQEAVITSKIRVHIYAPVSIALSDIGLFMEHKIAPETNQQSTVGYDNSAWRVLSSSDGKIDLDLGEELTFSAAGYLPIKDKHTDALIEKYNLFISNDGKTWTKIAEGEFSNIKANPILQRIALAHKWKARYISLRSQTPVKAKIEKAEVHLYN